MSKENPPEDKAPQNKTNKGVKLALLAGILGLAVGAGLYAVFGVNDNTEQAGSQIAGDCPFDPALQTKLDAAAGGHVAAFKALDRGYSVATIAFKDTDAQAKTLADWNGKTVLLNLWATWCAPCRAEMPALDALQGELGNETFDVVPISVDLGDDVKPKKFYEDIAIKNLGFYHDGDLASLNSLKKNGLAYGLPATVLVSADGCALGVLNGPAEWASDDAKKLIKAAQ